MVRSDNILFYVNKRNKNVQIKIFFLIANTFRKLKNILGIEAYIWVG